MNEYLEYIKEKLELCGEITAKKMFGGFCIYKDGKTIGAVVEGEFYLKTSPETRENYIKYNSEPFIYNKKDGKPIATSYFAVPEEVLEDEKLLRKYVNDAFTIPSKSTKKKRK